MRVKFDKILNLLREEDVTVVGGIIYGGPVGGGSLNGIFYEDGGGNFVNEPGSTNNIFGELNDSADTITLGDSISGIYFAGAASAGLSSVIGLGIDTLNDNYQFGNPSSGNVLVISSSGFSVVSASGTDISVSENLIVSGLNVFIGGSTGTAGYLNASVGYLAGNGNTGNRCTMMGDAAGQGNSGDRLVALGEIAGLNNTGTAVTALGYLAGYHNTGQQGTFVGLSCGSGNTGDYVSVLGVSAGIGNTKKKAIFIGFAAGNGNSGENVISIGSRDTLSTNQNNSGDNVIILGTDAGYGNTISNAFMIGNSQLPSFANYSAASSALGGGVSGNTYIYFNSSTNSIEGVRL